MTTPTPTPFQQVVAIGETLLKVFIGAALGVVIAWGPSILDKSMGDWKAVAAAGIAADGRRIDYPALMRPHM